MSANPKLLAPISTVTASTLLSTGELAELHHLALAGRAVVPVEAGLEVAAGLRVRARTRAGEVERVDPAADVGLGGRDRWQFGIVSPVPVALSK
jgi:hypothetical protein